MGTNGNDSDKGPTDGVFEANVPELPQIELPPLRLFVVRYAPDWVKRTQAAVKNEDGSVDKLYQDDIIVYAHSYDVVEGSPSTAIFFVLVIEKGLAGSVGIRPHARRTLSGWFDIEEIILAAEGKNGITH